VADERAARTGALFAVVTSGKMLPLPLVLPLLFLGPPLAMRLLLLLLPLPLLNAGVNTAAAAMVVGPEVPCHVVFPDGSCHVFGPGLPCHRGAKRSPVSYSSSELPDVAVLVTAAAGSKGDDRCPSENARRMTVIEGGVCFSMVDSMLHADGELVYPTLLELLKLPLRACSCC
jgi:hypothetical protein